MFVAVFVAISLHWPALTFKFHWWFGWWTYYLTSSWLDMQTFCILYLSIHWSLRYAIHRLLLRQRRPAWSRSEICWGNWTQNKSTDSCLRPPCRQFTNMRCSLLFEPEHQASTKDCYRVLLPVPGVTWLPRCDAEAEEYTLKVVRDASSSAQNKNADANSDTNLDLTCQQKLIQHIACYRLF